MLTHTNFKTPHQFGVIFVDCWESYSDNIFFKRILYNLSILASENPTNVPFKIFATYNYNLHRPDCTFSNSMKKFKEIGYFDSWMRTLDHNSTNTQEYGAQLSYQFDEIIDHNSFLVQDVEMFDRLQVHYMPDVTHWLVLGKSWDICYHDRPLGVKRIHEFYSSKSEVNTINFYSSTWGVKRYDCDLCEQDYIDDALPWATNGTLYRLEINES